MPPPPKNPGGSAVTHSAEKPPSPASSTVVHTPRCTATAVRDHVKRERWSASKFSPIWSLQLWAASRASADVTASGLAVQVAKAGAAATRDGATMRAETRTTITALAATSRPVLKMPTRRRASVADLQPAVG